MKAVRAQTMKKANIKARFFFITYYYQELYIRLQSYKKLRYARHGEGESIVEREFFAADVYGIESVGAVGTVFEQVFFRLGELFAGLILAEAVATVGDTG